MEIQKIPPSLHELQNWMRWIVTDPRGVRDALSDPFPTARPNKERYTSPSKNVLPWIVDNPSLDKTERLDIYAEAYFLRVLESMKSDFSVTALILGDVSFQKLVADYLKQHPSRTANIGEVGKHFSKFISTYDDLKTALFLESLIEMEWLTIESFYADDSGLLDSSQLGLLSDDDWENAEFELAPSAYLVESRWPLDVFARVQNESVNLDSVDYEEPKNNQGFLIFRQNGTVSVKHVPQSQFALLKKIRQSVSLISALEQVQNLFPDDDIGSEVMNWFNGWVSLGIICDLKISNKKVNL